MRGTVRSYSHQSLYGFISVEGVARDVFFHRRSVHSAYAPQVGQTVEFEMQETPSGLRAQKVAVSP